MRVILRGQRTINGKSLTSPRFIVRAGSLNNPLDAEYTLYRFNVFVEEWFARKSNRRKV